MKKLISTLIILLMVSLLVTSCSKAKKEGPQECFQKFMTSLSDKDFAVAWDMLSSKSQKDFDKNFLEEAKKEVKSLSSEKQKEENPVLGITGEEVLKMNAKDFFILLMENTEVGNEMAMKSSSEIESVKIEGNSAELKIKDEEEPVTMVKVGKEWKIQL